MFDLTPSQLPLLPFSDDKRLLPEIISDGNPDPETGWPAFPLAYHDVQGVRLYHIQDWIAGIALTDRPRKVWDDLQRRSKKIQVSDSNGQLITLADLLSNLCQELPYKVASGRTYQMDFGSESTLFLIAQRIRTETVIRDRILRYLEASGAKLDEYRIEPNRAIAELPLDPEKMLERAINIYRRMGKSDKWIDARVRSTVQRKRFTEAFQQALRQRPSQFHFAEITDDLRRGLWRRATKQLRAEMGLADGVNLSDNMTEVGLNFETLGESIAEAKLKQTDAINFEQAEDIVFSSGKLLRPRADAVSKWLGIDIPTERPLLPAKTKTRKS